jgi:hypothetical protein
VRKVEDKGTINYVEGFITEIETKRLTYFGGF